jgi:hypothetical protein
MTKFTVRLELKSVYPLEFQRQTIDPIRSGRRLDAAGARVRGEPQSILTWAQRAELDVGKRD